MDRPKVGLVIAMLFLSMMAIYFFVGISRGLTPIELFLLPIFTFAQLFALGFEWLLAMFGIGFIVFLVVLAMFLKKR